MRASSRAKVETVFLVLTIDVGTGIGVVCHLLLHTRALVLLKDVLFSTASPLHTSKFVDEHPPALISTPAIVRIPSPSSLSNEISSTGPELLPKILHLIA
jgi:hypothetical protein